MRFNVTAKDIKEGTRRSKVACPVARAVRRRFPHAKIRVYHEGILLNGIFFGCPHKVSDFIRNYDKKTVVKPMRFKLDEKLFSYVSLVSIMSHGLIPYILY